jgi:putative copper export protein
MLEVTLLSIILVWIHLIAATFWVGGMLFLSLVAVPLLKKAPDPVTAQRGFINLALRFRTLVWVALAILVVTGTILLTGQVNFVTPLGEWPPAVLFKLSLVLLLVVVSLAHDQFIGPKVRILKHKPTSELTIVETILIRFSPLIGRLTMLLGLGVLLAAVFMVRT